MRTPYKRIVKSILRDLLWDYRHRNTINKNTIAHILYKDGTVLTYPDDVDQIKLINIVNIHLIDPDNNMDFRFDSIDTRENVEWWGDKLPSAENRLIVEEEDEYYQNYFDFR